MRDVPTTEAVTLRPCEERDLDAVLEIYAPEVLAGLASFELEVPSLDEMRERRRRIVDAGFPYLVAECGGQVVGYAYAGPYRPRPGYRFTVENSVYVRADRHGLGIGRRLLGDLLSACERIGARQVVAVIGDSGNTASIGLHAALGFRHAGTLASVGFKNGRWVDVVLMQRELGPGDRTLPAS